jgi:hypothetical protein
MAVAKAQMRVVAAPIEQDVIVVESGDWFITGLD